MTLLSICQDAADTLGVTRPLTVIGNTDLQVRRLLAQAQREGAALRRRYRWQRCIREATFVTVATESQGAITTIAPAFDSIIIGTAWNRTQQRPIGILTPEEWQFQKSAVVTGPYPNIRLRGNLLICSPVPAAGETWAFEYFSKYFCLSNASADLTTWTADTDTGLLDEELMTLGVIWRFKKSNGLDYAQDFEDYEIEAKALMARDGVKRSLNMGDAVDAPPGNLYIPEGSWSL